MTRLQPQKLRWHDYVLERGDQLGHFWREHFDGSDHKSLFVMAKSFDPRTCVALEQLVGSGSLRHCDAHVLLYGDGDVESSDSDLVIRAEDNYERIRELIGRVGEVKTSPLKTCIDEVHRYTTDSATSMIDSLDELCGYTDVIVDVSGMPRSVFFPLLSKLLYLLDSAPTNSGLIPNLFAVVSEDPVVDAAIKHEGVDEFAEFLPYFRGGFEREAISDLPKVWIPILGEHRLPQLERIEDHVKPSETCPVLPSPARHPRRGDNLVAEYRTFLFDNRRGIDPRNFIYASEDNPFEVYRQLCQAVHHWRDALTPLGGCNVAFSALSSKLMSLGSLLAAYDLKTNGIEIGVAHVGCNNYRLNHCEPDTEVFGLWLTGRCYESE